MDEASDTKERNTVDKGSENNHNEWKQSSKKVY